MREVSPISEHHSWLAFRWFAEKARWVLYECVPNAYIEDSMRAELEGEHPDRLEDWARIVSAYQWEMYRTHKVHARPCWIIQGTKGGHLVEYDEPTKELMRSLELPTNPPEPGDLPYADFDERVVQQIVRMSKLTKVKNDLSEFKRKHGTTEGHKRTYNEALRQAREQYVKYLNAQLEDGDDLLAKSYRVGELEHQSTTEDDFVELSERQDENYVRRGRFSDAPITD